MNLLRPIKLKLQASEDNFLMTIIKILMNEQFRLKALIWDKMF